ncbi:MAG TPA: CRISPR-associated endonuclease Cas6 [Chitinophagales bacterium]|nr:CRISPR-associated endonuclease Cas6 [Chitinophagales bacterium]
MKKIRFLKIQFEGDLKPYEIPAFRGAVIEKAGRENVSFHNHLSDNQFLYGYPVIQYKTIGSNPALVCMEYGIDEVHHFFQRDSWAIHIGDRQIDLKVKRLQLEQYVLQVWDKTFSYRIHNWVALNGENYKKYLELGSELEKERMLEKIMVGNILSFAKGVKWEVNKPISLKLDNIGQAKKISYKGQSLMAFCVRFRTNVFLPDYMGLGKGVSHGFGVIKHERNRGSIKHD